MVTWLEWGVVALVVVWLAFVDPWVVEPWQRRRQDRRERREALRHSRPLFSIDIPHDSPVDVIEAAIVESIATGRPVRLR